MRISQLHPNEGQINGVPNNPRKITKKELQKLKASIKVSPEFMAARPIIVNENFDILGGNMRYRALCLLRDEGVLEDIIPDEWVRVVKWTRKKQREFVLKDNKSSGEDDLALLAKWDKVELAAWGYDNVFGTIEEQKLESESGEENAETIAYFEPIKKKRAKLWGEKDAKQAARTDLKECISLHKLDGGGFVASYDKIDEGILLTDINSVQNAELYVEQFAQSAMRAIHEVIYSGNLSDVCIITTPKRRHKEGFHFATAVCERLSELIAVPFYADCIVAKNSSRLSPQFELIEEPAQSMCILYDDILTTGSTIKAVRALLQSKKLITIIGVLNR